MIRVTEVKGKGKKSGGLRIDNDQQEEEKFRQNQSENQAMFQHLKDKTKEAWKEHCANVDSALQDALSPPPPPRRESALPEVIIETPEQRRARWLEWYGDGNRGAIKSVHERELLLNQKADRSYIGKEIKKAKQEAAEKNGWWMGLGS
ncbi:MAG: hypothetical protein IPH37_10655 [Burkholderiales bacterium]|nr:hypothetical protein [Burkholderiales bacterium]